MITKENIDNLLGNGGKVHDSTGNKVGSVGQIYVDDQSGTPSWVTVHTGLFGGSESFVPLQGAQMDGGDVQVAYTKDRIKDAPRMDAEGSLGIEEENRLYEYYGLGSSSEGLPQTEHGTGQDTGRDDAGRDKAGTDDAHIGDADQTMTRSEERLVVGTETHEVGRARLRKHVVTENVTKTVPVTHEELVVERVPITEANRTGQGAELGEDEQEVILREEKVVVDKETVPVEELRLGTKTVTEEETVNETVRKEEIDTPEKDRPGK